MALSPLAARWIPRARSLLIVLGLHACLLGVPGCQREATVPPDPEPAPTPMLELRPVEGRAPSLLRSEAPAAHGYARGDVLGLFAEIEGKRAAVGYGHVTQLRGSTLELLATFLPDEHRDATLWLGPLPPDEHLEHRLGRVLDSPGTGLVRLDVGPTQGVRLGDRYRVYDVTRTDSDPKPSHEHPTALLQVIAVDDDHPTVLTVLRQGWAPPGAWVERIEPIDAASPNNATLAVHRPITVLILQLSDDPDPDPDAPDPQRQYWAQLQAVLRGLEVARETESPLRVTYAERERVRVAGTRAAIEAVGRELEADLVLWARVEHGSGEAHVRPQVTWVDRERLGDHARAWDNPLRAKLGPVGSDDDASASDRSIHGLASWLAGLAYMQAHAYRKAEHHLEQVPLTDDLHRQWLSAQADLSRCHRVRGDGVVADAVVRRIIDHGSSTGMKWYEARGRMKLGFTMLRRHEYDETLAEARRAKSLAEADGDWETVGDAWDLIARVAVERGAQDEALRIRRDEQLPIYVRLGDLRSVALTWRSIGDELAARGDLDAALRIRRDKELPVFERLGDARNVALAWGRIARILYRRGELDEALRIRKQEQLPVFERLGDVREVAATWGSIAEIKLDRGEFDEVLRICREEQLPLYEQRGDRRGVARTWRSIGDVLQRRGELDEALRTHREHVLPVFEELGDARQTAITWGRIGDILYEQGKLDEALRIRTEKEFPVFEALGSAREVAIAWGKIADILQHRGDLDEALRIRWDEQLPAFERLGEVRSVAVTWGKIADILQRRGELDEALRIRTTKQLPVYEKLGSVREASVTWAKISDILARQGLLDEAIETYETKVLPAHEALGARRDLVFSRWGLARVLVARRGKGDRRRAESLLRSALKDAEALRLPQARSIRRFMVFEGFEVEP